MFLVFTIQIFICFSTQIYPYFVFFWDAILSNLKKVPLLLIYRNIIFTHCFCILHVCQTFLLHCTAFWWTPSFPCTLFIIFSIWMSSFSYLWHLVVQSLRMKRHLVQCLNKESKHSYFVAEIKYLKWHYFFLKCLVQFISEAVWVCCFCGKVLNYTFNLLNRDRTIQIILFLLSELWQFCFHRISLFGQGC